MTKFWEKSTAKRPHWIEPKQKQWTADEHAKLYHTTRWRNLRKRHISEHPFCELCKFAYKLVKADVVDHINPVAKGGEMFDQDNLQSLCHRCHNAKSAREK